VKINVKEFLAISRTKQQYGQF